MSPIHASGTQSISMGLPTSSPERKNSIPSKVTARGVLMAESQSIFQLLGASVGTNSSSSTVVVTVSSHPSLRMEQC